MDEVIGLVAVVLGLSIPLSVIFGVFRFKFKKLAMKQFLEEERQVLLEVKMENVELRNRLEQLESRLAMPASKEPMQLEHEASEDLATQLEYLAQKHRTR